MEIIIVSARSCHEHDDVWSRRGAEKLSRYYRKPGSALFRHGIRVYVKTKNAAAGRIRLILDPFSGSFRKENFITPELSPMPTPCWGSLQLGKSSAYAKLFYFFSAKYSSRMVRCTAGFPARTLFVLKKFNASPSTVV